MNFEDIKGMTFEEIKNNDDEIRFRSSDGRNFRLFHDQSCCESVTVEDIAGDLEDLIGTPILSASEETSEEFPEDIKPEYRPDSFTWTFYKIATIKGSATIRWYGRSNGYYSESVRFEEIK